MRHELAGVRTGRASVTILDGVHVEAYGSRMPLNQLAGLSVPEPTLIVAQPFDPSQLGAIEKAIRASDLGLNPANDGKVVRIPLPSLTEERRKELSRHVHKLTEEGRNSVRQVRRDANERLKKLLKDHKISEDDEKKGLDEVQKITDSHIKHIDELQKKKDAELLGKYVGSESSCGLSVSRTRQLRLQLTNCHVLFTHLECSVPCGAPPLDPRSRHHLCRCGAPLLARYDLDGARLVARDARRPRADDVAVPRADAALRRRSAGHARRGLHAAVPRRDARRDARPRPALRQGRVAQPDEFVQGARSVGGDHAREVPRRRRPSRCRRPAMPATPPPRTPPRPASRCEVFIPRDAKRPFVDECRLYGADVTLVDGLITDAGRIAAETGGPLGWYDVSTLKEPYRIEGKKTMAYELAEQMDWQWPDWIVYPTGGGTGMVGMWKAFDELEQIGWMPPRPAAAHGVGAGRGLRADRPRVRAGHREGAAVGERRDDRRRPARAARDRRLPDPARDPRERRHGARRLRRAMVDGMLDDRAHRRHQRRARRRRGAARRCAGSSPTARSSRSESVVLFNTGGALKYLDVLRKLQCQICNCKFQRSTVQSPNVTPSAFAVSSRSRSSGTVFVFPTTSSKRPRDDVRRIERHHRAELASSDEFDRLAAEPRRQHAIEARRRAAALQVTEHDRARFLAGHLASASQTCAPMPPSRSTRPSCASSTQRPPAALRERAFGDDDDAELGAPAVALAQPLRDDVEVERNLRNQDRVGAAGDAGVQRDPARVAAHHLDDHDALVRFGGRVQPIDRVGREGDRRVEAETVRRADDVVVDRLRARRRSGCRAEQNWWAIASVPSPPITTSAPSPILWNISIDAIGVVARAVRGLDRIRERVAAVDRAEDRAAEAQDAGDVARRQHARTAGLDQPVEAVFEADALDAAVGAGLDDGADDGVQAGRVAAAGEDADARDGCCQVVVWCALERSVRLSTIAKPACYTGRSSFP